MNLFSYDSKPMQILAFVGDLIILNFLFLICCLPIITIGAAQAGLHTAIKVLVDPEDDSSPSGAFFRGLVSGFGTITLTWGLIALLFVLEAVAAIFMGNTLWIVVIALVICSIFLSLIPMIHARFGCTPIQLVRNAFFLIFAHPLRSIGVTAMVFFPLFAFADALLGFLKWFDMYSFMAYTPIWGMVYFSGVYCFANGFMKKPFKTMTEEFNRRQGLTPDGKKIEEDPALPEGEGEDGHYEDWDDAESVDPEGSPDDAEEEPAAVE